MLLISLKLSPAHQSVPTETAADSIESAAAFTAKPAATHAPVPQPEAARTVAPSAATTRLEIRLSRREVVVYSGATEVKSYPVAIGRRGWETPTGEFQVMQMLQNPTWISPFTDEVVPADDPQNPLGDYFIGFWTDNKNWIGFHGTPNPETIGKAVSHGCIHLYNKDIEELFQQVRLGTPVSVIE